MIESYTQTKNNMIIIAVTMKYRKINLIYS